MSDSEGHRNRAKHFSEQVKIKLENEFGSKVDCGGDSTPSLQFTIKTGKNYDMRLEYNQTEDMFELYDKNVKTQTNKTLGKFSPANVTDPKDTTASDVVEAVKKHAI